MPSKKPAATKNRKPAKATKPAAKAASGVGIPELAKELGVTDHKALRARVRRIKGGAQVGKGQRYTWPSTKDKGFRSLVASLKG